MKKGTAWNELLVLVITIIIIAIIIGIAVSFVKKAM